METGIIMEGITQRLVYIPTQSLLKSIQKGFDDFKLHCFHFSCRLVLESYQWLGRSAAWGNRG